MIQTMVNLMKSVLFISLLIANLPAQETRNFSLEEAKAYAKKNNYDVQKAKLAIDVANKQKWQVIATGFPQITLSADMNKLIDIPTQLIPGEFFGEDAGTFIPVQFGVPYNASYGVMASQLIFSGSYIVGLQASQTFMQLSEQAHKKSEIDVGETITQSYFLVLMAEENRKVLASSLQNINQTYNEISELNKEGFVEATDVSQMQISVNQLETQLKSVEQQIDVTYKILKLQMGIDINASIVLTDSLGQLLKTEDISERLRRDFHVEDNIGFKLLLTQEKLADLTLKNEYSTFLPTISAFANIEKNAQRNSFNFFDTSKPWYKTTVAGIQLSWPIFSGGQKIFKVQQAKIELKQAELDRIKAQQGLDLQYMQARSALKTAYDSYQNSKENRKLANEVYEINLEKYKEGIISSLDLVQAHNQYLQAEGDYLKSAAQLLTARTTLDKLLNEI
jgi:outer membrane protein